MARNESRLLAPALRRSPQTDRMFGARIYNSRPFTSSWTGRLADGTVENSESG